MTLCVAGGSAFCCCRSRRCWCCLMPLCSKRWPNRVLHTSSENASTNLLGRCCKMPVNSGDPWPQPEKHASTILCHSRCGFSLQLLSVTCVLSVFSSDSELESTTNNSISSPAIVESEEREGVDGASSGCWATMQKSAIQVLMLTSTQPPCSSLPSSQGNDWSWNCLTADESLGFLCFELNARRIECRPCRQAFLLSVRCIIVFFS